VLHGESVSRLATDLQARKDWAWVGRTVHPRAVIEGLLRSPDATPSGGVASPEVAGGPAGVGLHAEARSVGVAGIGGALASEDGVGGVGVGCGPRESCQIECGLQTRRRVSIRGAGICEV